MPSAAMSFGRSEKTSQPKKVATGISRYCMGASVVEGANFKDHVMSKWAIVPVTPRQIISRLSFKPVAIN